MAGVFRTQRKLTTTTSRELDIVRVQSRGTLPCTPPQQPELLLPFLCVDVASEEDLNRLSSGGESHDGHHDQQNRNRDHANAKVGLDL